MSKSIEQQIVECLTYHLRKNQKAVKNNKTTNNRCFQIKIGSTPPFPNKLSIEKDLRMIKAALLYADKVDLYSYQTSLILQLLLLKELDFDQMLEIFQAVLNITDPSQAIEIAEGINKYKQYNHRKIDSLKVYKFRQMMKKSWEEHIIKRFVGKLEKESSINEILPILKSGHLNAYIFQSSDTLTAVIEFYLLLANAITSSTTYALFDASSANLINSAIDANILTVPESSSSRAKHISLAANILERLPLFDRASISEVMDIRKELKAPLVRFRQAIMTFSEAIQSEPWNKEFLSEAESLFRKEIEPAVLEIEESVNANKYLLTLSKKFFDKEVITGGVSTLVLVLSRLSELPEVVSQIFDCALPVAGAIGASKFANAAYDSYQEVALKNETVNKNQLFFYYKASEKLLA